MKIAANDAFERSYVQKFRVIASQYGEFVEYERDRAARDLGLHFVDVKSDGTQVVTPALAWFQLKGITAKKISANHFEQMSHVKISLETRHLHFWWMSPVNTYVSVYVESVDTFFVFNVSKWLAETYDGDSVLTETRKTISVSFAKTNLLDDHAFRLIKRNEMLSSLKSKLGAGDEESARLLRDAQVIKEIAEAGKQERKIRVRFINWISKTRSEIYFEMLVDEKWQVFRSHWQFMMGHIEQAFPYLKFYDIGTHAERDPDDWFSNDEDDYTSEDVLRFSDGSVAIGSGGASMEYSEILLGVRLNKVGKLWASVLKKLEGAGIIAINESPTFVSVAPWHARDL